MVGARVIASGEPSRSEALGHQEFVLAYKNYEPAGMLSRMTP
jgi:altronate hydrolase